MKIYMICTLWTPFQAERDWQNSYREILLIPLYIFYSLWHYQILIGIMQYTTRIIGKPVHYQILIGKHACSSLPDPNRNTSSTLPDPNRWTCSTLPDPNRNISSTLPDLEVNKHCSTLLDSYTGCPNKHGNSVTNSILSF